jgi:RNA 3'-terminal phosphate cyclase
VDALSLGTSVHAHAHYSNTKLGADVLGERGKPAEKIGRECALLLKEQMDSGACLDTWMADQILPYMALAGGERVSVAEVTDHCRSNMWVIEKFLPVKFTTKGNIISCKKIK